MLLLLLSLEWNDIAGSEFSNHAAAAGLGDDEEAGDSRNFMVGRDPANPSSVVGSQQGSTWASQPHTVQQRNAATNAVATGVVCMHKCTVTFRVLATSACRFHVYVFSQ